MTITRITAHRAEAIARLLAQFQEKANLTALVDADAEQIQHIEDAFADMAEKRDVNTAEGAQLDRLGAVLDENRFGLTDEDFRIELLARIGQNVSEGTPEDIINVFKLLMRARYVQYEEIYPAKVRLVAVGSAPIQDTVRIKDSIERSKPTCCEVIYIATVEGFPFVFEDDVDPQGRGFGDVNDAEAGGTFAAII